jgi:hypothetical protein
MDTKPIKKAQRWRKTFAKHLALISDQTERFIMARGNVNHFTRFDENLMNKTIKLKNMIDEFNMEYVEWIKINVDKNPERFIP